MKYLIILSIFASMYAKNPIDTTQQGYRVIQAEGKTVRMVPIIEYSAPGNEDHYRRLHHHGVALESSKMAYRIYFDKKQTIDIYCKRHRQMELSTSYWYPNDEQLEAGYGDDVLRVSGCIGVGSLKPYDTVKQKMVHFDTVNRRYQRIVEQGRKRGVMEMTVYGWQNTGNNASSVISPASGAPNGPLVDSLTTRYTMLNNAQGMMAEMFASQPVSNMCTGVQFIPLKTPKEKCDYIIEHVRGGVLLASYGTDWPVNDSIRYAKETVGLAVFVPEEYVASTTTDANNALCLLKEGTYARYYLMAVGTTKAEYVKIRNREEFFAFARKWARKPQK